MKLKGRIAVITGGSTGIGAETAKCFAREGASIAIIDINADEGEKTRLDIDKAGGSCTFYQADVSNAKQVESIVTEVFQDFPQIDILVNNAGIWRSGRVVDLEEDTWDTVLSTNLKSVYMVSKQIVPAMMKIKKGVIINVASVAGLVGAPDASAYAASKGGIVNLSRSMALDFAPYNIRVNCLCPGMIDSAQGDTVVSYYKPEMDALEAKRTWQPLSYVGAPGDVARAALYIASDDAAFMTGTIFVIDGGLTAQ